ncbi:YeeE/YedE family protein [Paracoccus sp. P2]|uniref:YeeE/YedE family protein n=1 Tax=Paracoccus pantotrophus TaxID=82367 RepID=A0A1I5MX72_PARPN|nr:membrane protein [Paracoccus pantotrophus]QFG34873.1 YeeE/YedE family protein [Paracoccus pantotrophus]QFG36283.1 YeeE/YedE family protein [Paracoccus pantotrophus]QLH13143.1 YeeE/YedE family protein [Paracoccus pantotrophus]QLH16587.1 YeeE/YedE family protein [Paracoccus pantotrophus]RDD92536.1 YeeE/YedE family protein [Paracoccus pantotrophus]
MTAFTTEFTPVQSLLGGGLVGLAAVLLMALHGRIAGMTGILAGAFAPGGGWRLAFLAGAVAAPLLLVRLGGVAVDFSSPVPLGWTALSGLMVGIGVSYGGGCTSGHGVCGLARLSARSLVATLSFMLATGATVYATRHLAGGF